MNAFNDDRRRRDERRSGKDRRQLNERNHSLPEAQPDEGKPDAVDRRAKLSLRLAEMWYKKGKGFLYRQQYTEAKEALNNALRIKPNLAEAQYGLAEAYSMEGKKVKALYHLERAIEIDEDLKSRAERGSAFKEFRGDKDFKNLVS
jgi:tetratricopeptide (TPR) repeat protein